MAGPNSSKLILPGDPEFNIKDAINTVNRLHDYDDVDSAPDAHHHTLGNSPFQAAPGNHKHTPSLIWIGNSSGVVQAIPANVWTRVTMQQAVGWYKTWGTSVDKVFSHNTASNQVDILKDGLYFIEGHIPWETAAGYSTRWIRIRTENVSSPYAPLGRIAASPAAAGAANEMQHTGILPLKAGEFVALDAYTNEARSIVSTVTPDEWIFPHLIVSRIGEFPA